jgi:hypothetical protein
MKEMSLITVLAILDACSSTPRGLSCDGRLVRINPLPPTAMTSTPNGHTPSVPPRTPATGGAP